MSYATQTSLIEAFGELELAELLDRDNDESADAGALERAIAYADSFIDGYLRGKYAVPLLTPPALLVGVANDIVRYRLYDTQAPEEVTKRHDKAVDALKAIANGTMTLASTPSATPSAAPAHSAPARVFTQDTLADF